MHRYNKKLLKKEKYLRDRITYLIKESSRYKYPKDHPDLFREPSNAPVLNTPTSSIYNFLEFSCDVLPQGGVYLFGGVLRDIAMSGDEGFTSDFDIVVEGDWTHFTKYLENLGASQNKFGGFRLDTQEWKVDIWAAQKTWAIQKGLVQYLGIGSLTKTTILNWDAILLDWRNKRVICPQNYFPDIEGRLMDIVLEQNPNPLGAAVKAFRHYFAKEAKLTARALRYLCNAVRDYTSEAITRKEISIYPIPMIDLAGLRIFEQLNTIPDDEARILVHDDLRRESKVDEKSDQFSLFP